MILSSLKKKTTYYPNTPTLYLPIYHLLYFNSKKLIFHTKHNLNQHLYVTFRKPRELVLKLEKIIGKKFQGQLGGRPYRKREIMSPVRPKNGLPWKDESSKTTIREGITELISLRDD